MSPAQSSRGAPKKIDKNALLVAQEITFAKILSGNNEKIRARGIKRLQRWLTARSNSTCPFKENDLNRVWKGLFYCMWMSDKPLIQEEVAESISKLVHCFKNGDAYICFVKCFFLTMATEWRGLDHWRIDKFLMFIRRFIRQVLIYLEQRSWPVKLVTKLGVVINSTVLPDHATLSTSCHPPIGFSMHFIDVYMDELTKVSKGQLQQDNLLVALLRPFAVYLSEATERTLGLQVVTQIFDRLIEQSKEGHKFREKFEAWKQLGFPGGSINAIMKVTDGDSEDESDTDVAEDDDEEEKALDPRAGGVSVILPVARFNPEAVANLLREFRHTKTSNSWSRRMIARVISRFCSVKEGKYPLGVTKIPKIPQINFKKLAKESANELYEFTEKLRKENDEDWIENIKKRKEAKKQAVKDKQQNKQTPKKDAKLSEEEEEEEEDDDDDDGSVDYDEIGDDDAEDDDISDDVAEDEDVGDDVEEDDDVGDDVEEDDDVGDDDQESSEDGDDDVENEEDDVDIDEPVEGGDDESEEDEVAEDGEEKKTTEQVAKLDVKKECNNVNLSDKCSKHGRVPLKKDNITVDGASNSPVTSKSTSINGRSNKLEANLKNEAESKEEVVIVVGRKRKLAEARSTPVIQRVKCLKSAQNSPRTPQTPGSAKKLQFILNRNTFQTTWEYDKLLKDKPGNPYDSSKKPRYSVLKSTPLASPVNPFYTP